MQKKIKVLFTGGGTGGHINPNLTILSYLEQGNTLGSAYYIGGNGFVDKSILGKQKFKCYYIKAVPFVNLSKLKQIINIFAFIRSVFQAAMILIKVKPNLIIAAGGYVSAPVIAAAVLIKPFIRLKVLAHEQNYIPGKVNQFFSFFVDVNLLSFEATSYYLKNEKCFYAGYPLRIPDVSINSPSNLRTKLNIPDSSKLLLIMGGSLGSRTINNVTMECLADFSLFSLDTELLIVHSIGLNNSPDYNAWDSVLHFITRNCTNLKTEIGQNEIKLYNSDGRCFYMGYRYIYNAFDFQRSSNLIVSRAGAGGVFETINCGVPSILVPKRDLPGNHQELNAVEIAKNGLSDIIFEKYLNGIDCIDNIEFFNKTTELLTDDSKRMRMVEKLEEYQHPNTYLNFIESINWLIYNTQPPKFTVYNEMPNVVKFLNQFDALIAYLDQQYKSKDYNFEIYNTLYSNKIDGFLKSNDYLIQNKAIKLIGALRKVEYYDRLVNDFSNYKGFVKRNALIALQKAPLFQRTFKDVVFKGIVDSYFEVQREAYLFILMNIDEFSTQDFDIIKANLFPFKNFRKLDFEVQLVAMKVLIYIFEERIICKYFLETIKSPNTIVRKATLDALSFGIRNNKINRNNPEIQTILKNLVLSSTDYEVVFSLKKSYNKLLEELC